MCRGRTKSPPETWRECSTCKRMLDLNLENFGRHLTGRNGWMPRCRPCMRAYKRGLIKQRRDRLERIRLANAPPLKPGQICEACSNLSHRRPAGGCPRCREPYAPLPPIELVFRRSWSWAV